MNLSEIRKNIDSIDQQIIKLLCERMNCSLSVADYKRQNDMPVFDSARENDILDRMGKAGGNYGSAVRAIYSTIMEQSRALQYPLIDSEKYTKEFTSVDLSFSADNVKRIACQGVDGAYSSLAGRALYKNADIIFCRTWSDVCDAVEKGEAEFGVLPVENSWAGSVHAVYDLLIDRKFYINAAIDAHISHSLLALPKANISGVKRVLSHEQALRQCADFISKHGLEATEYFNTAAAVKAVSESNDISLAAIGSKSAGKLYGLESLHDNIASSCTNTTRFVSISNKLYTSPSAEKISLVFSLPHITGSLYKTLARFASTGLNLTKLESRPIKGKDFEYMFFVDVLGCLSDNATLNMIGALSEESPEFHMLGNYSETTVSFE